MATAPCRRLAVSPEGASSAPRLTLDLLQVRANHKPVKFDAAFIERRMREHRELQERMAMDLAIDIVREVEAGIVNKLAERTI